MNRRKRSINSQQALAVGFNFTPRIAPFFLLTLHLKYHRSTGSIKFLHDLRMNVTVLYYQQTLIPHQQGRHVRYDLLLSRAF